MCYSMNLPEGIIRTYIMVMSFGTSAINSLECMHGTTSPLLNDDIFEGFLGGFGGGFFPAGFVQNVFRLRSARCFNPDDVCFRCEASLGPISPEPNVAANCVPRDACSESTCARLFNDSATCNFPGACSVACCNTTDCNNATVRQISENREVRGTEPLPIAPPQEEPSSVTTTSATATATRRTSATTTSSTSLVTGDSVQQDVILPTVLGAVGLVCFSLILVAFIVVWKRKQAPQPVPAPVYEDVFSRTDTRLNGPPLPEIDYQQRMRRFTPENQSRITLATSEDQNTAYVTRNVHVRQEEPSYVAPNARVLQEEIGYCKPGQDCGRLKEDKQGYLISDELDYLPTVDGYVELTNEELRRNNKEKQAIYEVIPEQRAHYYHATPFQTETDRSNHNESDVDYATYESVASSPSLSNPKGSSQVQVQNKTNYEVSSDGHEKRVRHSQTVSDEAKSPVNAHQKRIINNKQKLDLIFEDAVNRNSCSVVEISPTVLNEGALKSETNYYDTSAEGNIKDKQDGGQNQKVLKATKTQDNDEEQVEINKDSSKQDFRQQTVKNENSTLFTKTDDTKAAFASSQILATKVKVDSKNPDLSKSKEKKEKVADSQEENVYEKNVENPLVETVDEENVEDPQEKNGNEGNYVNIEKKDNNEKLHHENDCEIADANVEEL